MSTVQTIDSSVDVLKVIPWMSDGSPNLRGLLDGYQRWYASHHRDFWVNWERDVFNLNTANDFGLNIWSIILDLPLYIPVQPSPATYPAWGFGPFGRNFDNGNFSTDVDYASRLTTEQKRKLLKLRMWQITSSGSLPDINRAMTDVFGPEAYALDGHDMSITYVFTTYPDDAMLSLVQRFDILPRPSGVKANYAIAPRATWGFGLYAVNFDQPHSQFAS